MSLKSILITSLLSSLVAGHGAIISATGDAGGTGMAIGIVSTTPRDGTRRDPFQQDSTRFKGDQADTFGETLGGGNNNLEAGTKAIMAETGDQLPQVSQGGEISMALHQVNADGGGPYTCEINSDGTGQSWESIDVTTTPPGKNSRNRSGAQTDFPMAAAIPQSQTCTGEVAGQDNVCLVKCKNAARAGPFGGVVPVQLAGANNTAANARFRLARAVRRDSAMLTKMMRRSAGIDLSTLDADEIAELRDDGDI